jgi:hypothetical protein
MRKVNKCGTYVSTSQTCDHPIMSIESNLNVIGSPSTTIYYVISWIPSTPSTLMVVVLEIHTSIVTQPMSSTRPLGMNPFRSLFGMPGYNSQSIPLVSNPIYFGMPNMMSQLSSSILVANANPSFGTRGMTPLYDTLSFGGGYIPQTNLIVGGFTPFYSRPNPSLNALGWSAQPGKQVTSYIFSFIPSYSMSISTNTFIMDNPPLSSRVP